MPYVIELNDGDVPTYWSDSSNHHPAGHWGDKANAKLFDAEPLAQQYIDSRLNHQAELCKVIPQ